MMLLASQLTLVGELVVVLFLLSISFAHGFAISQCIPRSLYYGHTGERFPYISKSSIYSIRKVMPVVGLQQKFFHRLAAQNHGPAVNGMPVDQMMSAATNQAAHGDRIFSSQADYITHIQSRSALPIGFQVGSTRFSFNPIELPRKTLPMNVTVVLLDEPTDCYAVMYTSNRFPGGPIIVGKDRFVSGPFSGKDYDCHHGEVGEEGKTIGTGASNQVRSTIQAVVINNKISNVCPGGLADRGVGDCKAICAAVAKTFDLDPITTAGATSATAVDAKEDAAAEGMTSSSIAAGDGTTVFPSSTGVIGWRLPVDAIIQSLVRSYLPLYLLVVLLRGAEIVSTKCHPWTPQIVINASDIMTRFGRFLVNRMGVFNSLVLLAFAISAFYVTCYVRFYVYCFCFIFLGNPSPTIFDYSQRSSLRCKGRVHILLPWRSQLPIGIYDHMIRITT